jgi:uncharacterized coiled-coil protein SlyX
MISSKQIKEGEKSLAQQHRLIAELNAVVKDIERCEKTMTSLQTQLTAANAKFQGQRTTREEIAYLTLLLDCAKRKLAWEKQLASLQKRTPPVLEKMAAIMNDAQNPPAEQTRAQILDALQKVQAAMTRLQGVKVE